MTFYVLTTGFYGNTVERPSLLQEVLKAEHPASQAAWPPTTGSRRVLSFQTFSPPRAKASNTGTSDTPASLGHLHLQPSYSKPGS